MKTVVIPLLVFLTLALTPLLAAILYISTAYLYPVVMAVVVFGVFAIEYSTANILIAIVAGGVGLLLQKLDYPAVPLILGLVLGPMLERNIRRTMISSQGDLWVFVSHPISLICLVVAVIVFALPLIQDRLARRVRIMDPDAVRAAAEN